MSENAKAGWYSQPDGSQRYWDGEEWTEHIAPAPEGAAAAAPGVETPGAPDTRQWWQKKRVIIPGAAAAALVFFSAVGAAAGGGTDDDEDVATAASTTPAAEVVEVSDEEPESAEDAEPVTFVMPDVVGDDLQSAQDSLQALGSFFMDQEDATGEGRVQIVDSNWRVCTQVPAAGEEVGVEFIVVLAAVKEGEACPGDAPVEEAAEEAPAEDSMRVSQQQAVRSAEGYLAFTSFSRSGLIDQLEFEGFPTKDAEFAVDYLDINWKEQAALSAETYLDFTSFSRSGLIDQLMYEGFTKKQAEYGADSVGL